VYIKRRVGWGCFEKWYRLHVAQSVSNLPFTSVTEREREVKLSVPYIKRT